MQRISEIRLEIVDGSPEDIANFTDEAEAIGVVWNGRVSMAFDINEDVALIDEMEFFAEDNNVAVIQKGV